MDIVDQIKEANRRIERYVKEGNYEYAAIERDKIKNMKDIEDKLNKFKYSEECREERNWAAILYAVLLDEENLKTFINSIPEAKEFSIKDTEIFYEFAYLRDFWHTLDDKLRLAYIQLLLEKHCPRTFEGVKKLNSDVVAINKLLGYGRYAKTQTIVSPGTWGLDDLANNFKEEIDNLAKIKWAFNCKPDLVIKCGEYAICIETKLGSGQGNYKHHATSCGQLELQKFLMEDILSLECKYILIASSKGSFVPDYFIKTTWEEVFNDMELRSLPEGVLKIIEK